MAARAKKIPDNLYELCLTNLVNYLHKLKCERNDLRCLPDTILMDVYYKVSVNIVIYKNISYYRYKMECFLYVILRLQIDSLLWGIFGVIID